MIEIDGAITSATIGSATNWLGDPARRSAAAAGNYEICRDYFSYEAVRNCLLPLLSSAG